MRKIFIALSFLIVVISCKNPNTNVEVKTETESKEITLQQEHENPRMRFKLIQPRYRKNSPWNVFAGDLENFSQSKYNKLKPLIIEKNIYQIQAFIEAGQFTYADLVLFYLYRIKKFEADKNLSLNTIIALNPQALKQARECDANLSKKDSIHPVFGMPILVKDNIGTTGMPTTAGAVVLENNRAKDAFIVEKLKEKGAIILGKVNLSEWAYYFCEDCPLGYSAIGGQTLNPYGRKIFETGGSSSGSGVAVAANYAVAAVGTETAGSILSPSGQNSIVGLKPTVGLLSRSGIVPISTTLDTPGPMTKSVVDNAILLDAMSGKDSTDAASITSQEEFIKIDTSSVTFTGKRFGVFNSLIEEDSIYNKAVEKIKQLGGEIYIFDPPAEATLDNFLTLLNVDMKNDLPAYLSNYASKNITVKSINDIVEFNLKDVYNRAPYNQKIFENIINETTTTEQLSEIKINLELKGRLFFDEAINTHNLDAILSVNNYHAAFAAVAKYPCITVPMGYKASGEPVNLTFVAKPFNEKKLLELGYIFEKATQVRKQPEDYK
ncbi:amidase family protein [Abyssalbus ytuae]|uniref:Amidase family protein n=1 Tax=Abyssalbus ytuae TaxID=2926907 RepID=A0A9E6ZQL8_9FLAO|nr:amidase family protein [Abyssalbus ytuae]UOB16983.1 amidase family protein [Abyssalbus ytuae]